MVAYTASMKWVRWLLVLPGGFVGAIALLFVLRFFLQRNLGSGGDQMVTMDRPALDQLELTLTGAVSMFGVVFIGALIAPSHRIQTSWVLGGLMMLFIVGIRFIPYPNGMNPWHPVPLAMNIVGIIAAVVLTKKLTKAESVGITPQSKEGELN